MNVKFNLPLKLPDDITYDDLKQDILRLYDAYRDPIEFKEKYILEKYRNDVNEITSDDYYKLDNKMKKTFSRSISFNKNLHKDFQTVVIWASEDERVKRLIDRGMEINDIRNRIKSQPTDEWWKSIGTLIINNDLDQLEIDIKNYINGFINE